MPSLLCQMLLRFDEKDGQTNKQTAFEVPRYRKFNNNNKKSR